MESFAPVPKMPVPKRILPTSSWPDAVELASEMLLPMRMFCEPVVRLAIAAEEVAVPIQMLLEPVVMPYPAW